MRYSFPLVIAMLCHWGCLIDPEKLTKFGWFCNIGAFLGIVLAVSAEDESGASADGIILAALSTLCWAIQVILIRRTRSEAHWLEIEFVTGFVNAVVLSPGIFLMQYLVTTFTNRESFYELTLIEITAWQWFECIVVGAVAFAGLACLTIGFQLEEAPRGSVVMYLEIPIMYIAQWVFFGEGISCTELVGVVIMILGILGAAGEKIVMIRMGRESFYFINFSSVPHHVALVGSQEAGGVVQLPPLSAQLLLDLLHPVGETVEGLPLGDVHDEQQAMSISVELIPHF